MTSNAANFARQILASCLLTHGASFAVSAQQKAPKDDLQILSDELNDEKSLADWKQFHELTDYGLSN